MRINDPWREQLRQVRESARLSREELARKAGLAPVTIKGYEMGSRTPSREMLTVLLDALDVDRFERNRILEGAGFRPDGLDVWRRNPDFAFTFDEARAEIHQYKWPSLITGEGLRVLATNDAYARLWGRTSNDESQQSAGFLGWMSYPSFASRLKNWDEVMAFLIGVLKGSLRFPEQVPEGTSASIRRAMDQFLAGDARYIKRYLDLWDRTPAATAKSRFSYHIVFDHVALGTLEFRCLGTGVNEVDGLIINDWIPANAATWMRLSPPR